MKISKDKLRQLIQKFLNDYALTTIDSRSNYEGKVSRKEIEDWIKKNVD